MKMKDKKAEQIEFKKRHKERLRANRRTESPIARPKPKLEEKPTILIVCEGENTEPSYFKQFRLSSATIMPVGEGFNTITLVRRAIQIAAQGSYEQVWCVFDKDDFTDVDFNNAVSIAEAQNFGVAYSNQAFEYWIILHFDDHQGGGMHRNDYAAKINDLLKPYNLKYDGKKSKTITEDLFELLEGIDEKTQKVRKVLAIERAKRIFDRLNHKSHAQKESSTTVFRLVEELMKYV